MIYSTEGVAMTIHWKRLVLSLTLFLGITILALDIHYAEGKSGMEGWEKNSEYNKFYDTSEADRIKGVVVGIKVVNPLPGMAPGLALIVKDSGGELVTVHLGPKSFINLNTIGIRKGDKLKIKGVWAEIGEDDVFMASKLKKGNSAQYKVRRTSDGTPYWTMSAEELAREQ